MNLNFNTHALSQPWAIVIDALKAIGNTLASINSDLRGEIKASRSLLALIENDQPSQTAIIEITGPIVRYSDLFAALVGATSIEQIQADLQAAITDPQIQRIILHIDSPGGTVAGVHELANSIYAARSIKPITAYVSSLGASAAYWLASSADEIVIDATAAVGSIGVISTIIDDSERKAKAGINEITIVSSHSPNKHLDAMTDNGRIALQSLVDSIADVFVADVARNRNVRTETVLSDFGQGGLLVGKEAVKAGLADRLGSLFEVIQSLTIRGKSTMKTTLEAAENHCESAASTLTLEHITAHYPTLAATLRSEGAQLERERIQGVEEQLLPGYEALINALKYDGKTTGVEAAVKVLAAEKQQQAMMLKQLKQESSLSVPASDGLAAESCTTSIAPLSKHEQITQEWQASSALRDEFGCLEAYTAYCQAEAMGLVKIIGTGI